MAMFNSYVSHYQRVGWFKPSPTPHVLGSRKASGLRSPLQRRSSSACRGWCRGRGPQIYHYIKVSRNGGAPIAGWFIMENPNLKWMIQGYPYFRKPPYPIVPLQNMLFRWSREPLKNNKRICLHPNHLHPILYTPSASSGCWGIHHLNFQINIEPAPLMLALTRNVIYFQK